uniref:Uncharacterized protein n=1 Tax=Triticum urartu TaxID=4572 RepID=A0A8R7UFW0_TRIUA
MAPHPRRGTSPSPAPLPPLHCPEHLARPAPDQQVASVPDASSSRMPGRAAGPRRVEQGRRHPMEPSPPGASSPAAASPPDLRLAPLVCYRRVLLSPAPPAARPCLRCR